MKASKMSDMFMELLIYPPYFRYKQFSSGLTAKKEQISL